MPSRSCQNHQEQSNPLQAELLRVVHRLASEAWADAVGDLCLEYPETPYFSLSLCALETVVEVLVDTVVVRTYDWTHTLYEETLQEGQVSLWPTLIQLAHAHGLVTMEVV